MIASLDSREIAAALGVSDRAVRDRALRERWPYTEQPVRGGRKRFYRLEDLPVEVRAAVLLKGDFGGGAGCAFAAGTGTGVPQGHQGSAAVDAATAAARPAPSAGNGALTRGAGSIPATPTYQEEQGALAGGAESSLPLLPAGVAPALPAATGDVPEGGGAFFRDEAQALRAVDAFYKAPRRVRDEAERRMRLCLAVRELTLNGVSARQAMQSVAAQAGVPMRTLERWWYGQGEFPGVAGVEPRLWLPLLAPRWGKVHRDAPMTETAWQHLLADYLRPEGPSLLACYKRVLAHAEQYQWQVPSYDAVARRVKKLPLDMVVLAREGPEAFERLFPAMRRSVAHLSALEWVNADGHKFDVFVRLPQRFEDVEKSRVVRPHLIAVQDVYSRKILAWRLSPTLNALSVQLCFADLIGRYGLPEHALMDNGREFGAKAITGGVPWRFRFKALEGEPLGMLRMLGVHVHWATPFHGQSKPIERAFRDLCEAIAKDPRCAGAYTGNAPDAKPENYGSKAMDWEAFEQVVAEGIARHNAQAGRRTETAQGRSFDETFRASYSKRVVRKLAPSQRALLLLASEPVKVSRQNDFGLCGNRYGVDPQWGLAGQRIVARFDPDDLAKPPVVCLLDGTVVGEAWSLVRRFNDQGAAQEFKRAHRQLRRLRREQMKVLQGIERLVDPAVAEPGLPDPAAVRVFQVQAGRPEADAEVQALVAKTDALILEMARQRAVG
jgi:putative transposase